MMKVMSNFIFGILQMITLSNSQPLVGSGTDNGCVTDGGYQWCPSLNECVRPWVTPCPNNPPVVDPGFGVPVVDPLPPTPNNCMSTPCQNSGLCQTQPSGYTCLCNSGYTGTNCETLLPPPPPPSNIPYNCAEYYDGCNHCQVINGQLGACTRMYCFTQGTSQCLSYNRLNEGDICYRFCENGSEQTINAQDKCPSGTSCRAPGTHMSFDSCGSNAWTCQASH